MAIQILRLKRKQKQTVFARYKRPAARNELLESSSKTAFRIPHSVILITFNISIRNNNDPKNYSNILCLLRESF